MKPTRTDDKPAAAQGSSLQELLSAAFVVQQHNERLHMGQPPETGHSQILKEVLEVQEQLRGSHLDLREKAALVARRVRQMTQASGSAIGALNQDHVEYYAATGSAASLAGASVARVDSLAQECLETGQMLQCSSTETDPRVSQELCHALGVKALIGVPLKRRGKVVGVLEVHFAQFNSFHDQEVRTCQLLSALVEDAIVKGPHDASDDVVRPGVPPKTSNAQPRVNFSDTESLLAALEKIRPKLERLARNQAPAAPAQSASAKENPAAAEEPDSSAGVCRNCDHRLAEDEVFCGNCGSPRQTQHIWSSLLELQRKAEASARQGGGTGEGVVDAFDDPLDVFPSELEEIVAKFSGESFETKEAKSAAVSLPAFAQGLVAEDVSSGNEKSDPASALFPGKESALEPEEAHAASAPASAESTREATGPFLIEKPPETPPPAPETYPPFTGFASDTSLLSLPAESEPETAADPPATPPGLPSLEAQSAAAAEGSTDETAPWNSAAKTKEWLEIERNVGRNQEGWLAEIWREQRANVYLAVSALLLVVVLLGWAAPSKPPSEPVAGTAKASHAEPAPQPDLTLSEKLLVSLGLAEAPAPETDDPGNPDAKVWIDVHTALYYCPGSDLYGKTPGGRTTSQREAQEDQFQPAMRKACK